MRVLSVSEINTVGGGNFWYDDGYSCKFNEPGLGLVWAFSPVTMAFIGLEMAGQTLSQVPQGLNEQYQNVVRGFIEWRKSH